MKEKADPNLTILEKINTVICARESEIELIRKHFDRMLEGGFGACFVSGAPGIGKTYLVRHAIKEMEVKELTFVYGKFRQHDEKPLIAINEVLEQITKHIMTLPQDKLSVIKKAFIKSLSSDSQIITSICPYTKKLLGQQKIKDTNDYKRIKYRIRRAIYQFLSMACEVLFPLVILIDDLHWADAPSLDVLETMIKGREDLNMLLLLASRDNEPRYMRKIETILQYEKTVDYMDIIKLNSLTSLDISEYIRAVFGCDVKGNEYISRMIYSLSLGYPLYIKGLIELFIKEGVLSYLDSDKIWIVYMNRLNGLELPKDIEAIISQNANRVTDEEKRLLELIACFDGPVSTQMLAALTGLNRQRLDSMLRSLCDEAFFIGRTDSHEFCFIHDTVLDKIYQGIPDEQRAKIHYSIAENMRKEQKVTSFFTASHLMRTDIELLKADALKWVRVLYTAGLEAKHTAAIEQAQKIFTRCVELITDEKQSELLMKVRLELAECLFIAGKQEEAKESYSQLLKEYREPSHVLEIKRRYLSLYAYKNDVENVLTMGEEILGHLHYKLSMKRVGIGVLFNWKTTRGIEKIKNSKEIKVQRILTILDTFAKMVPCAYITGGKKFMMLLMQMGILTIRHGYSPSAAMGYAAYSLMYNSVWKNPKKMIRIAEITLERIKHETDVYGLSLVYFVIGTFILPLSIPLKASIEYLGKSIYIGKRTGDFVYSGFSAASVIHAKYLAGESIHDITRYIDEQESDTVLGRQDTLGFICDIYKRHIHYLANGKKEDTAFKDKQVLSIDTMHFLQIESYYLSGKYEKAYELVKNVKSNTFKGYVMVLNLMFFSALTRLQMHRSLDTKDQKPNKRIIKECIKELEYWVKICKDNHYEQLLLLRVEYARRFNTGQPIEGPCNEAISFAEKKGNLRMAATGYLMAAKRYDPESKLARFYAGEASKLFREWGAAYVAELVEHRFGIAVEAQTAEKQPLPGAQPEAVNRTVLQELAGIQHLDEIQVYTRLVELLGKTCDANYTAILFEQSTDMYLHCEMRGQVKVFEPPRKVELVADIAHKIIRYVQRTGEEVVIQKKTDAGIFANDNYIAQQDEISVLCLPVSYHGVLIGVIYMERIKEFSETTVQIVKNVIPLIVSKKAKIGNINLKNMLTPKKEMSPLSDREQEILERIARGISNAAISRDLNITVGTVKNHLSSIYGKLGVDSRIQAVIRAKEMNLIDI